MADLNRDIEKYLRNELSPAERHALEKKALSDPFLADALEGHQQLTAEEYQADLNKLTSRIDSATAAKTTWYWPLRIAAGVALMAVGSLLVLYWLPDAPQEIVQNTAKPIPDSIATQPSERSEGEKTIAANEPKPDKKNSGSRAQAPVAKQPEQEALVLAQKEDAATDQSNVSSSGAAAPAREEKEAALTKDEKAKTLEVPPVVETEKHEKQVAETKSVAPVEPASSVADRDDALQRKRSSQLSLANQLVQGQVRSADDGSPLPGVNVMVKGTTQGTVTDANGNYQLEVPTTQNQLVFSFIGFASKEQEVKNPEQNDVALDADVSQLSEVVVTGYGFDENGLPKTPTYVTTMPEPVGGRKAFQKYLESNVQYPPQALEKKIEGRVTVQFTVKYDGQLTEFNVVRSLGYGCDEELIRLIRQGPAWSPSTRNEVPRDTKVKIRLRFSLPKKG